MMCKLQRLNFNLGDGSNKITIDRNDSNQKAKYMKFINRKNREEIKQTWNAALSRKSE